MSSSSNDKGCGWPSPCPCPLQNMESCRPDACGTTGQEVTVQSVGYFGACIYVVLYVSIPSGYTFSALCGVYLQSDL